MLKTKWNIFLFTIHFVEANSQAFFSIFTQRYLISFDQCPNFTKMAVLHASHIIFIRIIIIWPPVSCLHPIFYLINQDNNQHNQLNKIMNLEPRLRGDQQYQNLIESQSTRDQSISPPSQIGSHFDKKIQQAIDIKNDGNVEFKAQRYDEARNVYQKALGLLEPSTFYGATETECVKMAELSANLLFNIGSCFFNQHKWREAEMIYNEAITVNPYYIKALYKRAVARYELGQFQGAMADIKQAFNLDKSNKEIYETYEKIIVKYNESVKKQREKSKELSEKIFNTSKVKPKEAEAHKQSEKEEDGGNKWWILPLVSLVGVGLYHGMKFFRK